MSAPDNIYIEPHDAYHYEDVPCGNFITYVHHAKHAAVEAERDELRRQVERLKSVVNWRAYQAQFARGQSAPDDIETARAAWARDQELILDQREEIAALKVNLNKSSQKNDQLRAEVDRLKYTIEQLKLCGENKHVKY